KRLGAQICAGREREERFDDRTGERDCIAPVLPPGRCGLGHRRDEEWREPCQIVTAVEEQRPPCFVRENVLPELRTKRRKALIDRGKSLLLLSTELCPCLDEALPSLFENPARLAVEIETFTPRVK